MQPSDLEPLLEPLPDCNRNVLGRGYRRRKLRHLFVEVPMVHRVDDFAVQDVLELLQIDNEARDGIDLALHCDFQGVIMPMSIQVGALAKDATVLLVAPLRIVVIMRGRKLTLARQIDHVPLYYNDFSDCRSAMGDTATDRGSPAACGRPSEVACKSGTVEF